MKITILLNQPYPNGMALTNRIHLFAKRFHERGHDVEMVMPKQTETHRTAPRNTQQTGVYDGIKFWYPLSPARSKNFIIRRFNDVTTYFITLSYILRTKRDSDIFLLIASDIHVVLTYKIFCVLFNCKYVTEKGEFPFIFTQKNALNSIYHRIYINTTFRLFDGLIAISQSLFDYFKNVVSSKTELMIVPILTDIRAFTPTKNDSNEIVYAGTLNQGKDGIMDLLQGFLLFSKKIPSVKLVLMGDINISPEKDKINSFIRDNNLERNVEITGYVSRPFMIDKMVNASVLVLAKPSSVQADHCFPTKIAEYLSTGKPVLTTITGSIPHFLNNKTDSYLIEPNNPVILADALFNVFSDRELSAKIGENGRLVAQTHFDYVNQGDRVLSFFEKILDTHK